MVASAFLASALRPLMSAKKAGAMGGSPKEVEALTAPVIDPRPTRWMMLRGKLKTVKITYRKASAFLAKPLLPLMSAAGRRDG